MSSTSVLVLGMEGSGKTAVIKRLLAHAKSEEPSPDALPPATQPTMGVEMYTLTLGKPKQRFEVKEVGGQMVQLWDRYFEDAQMVIFVIDAARPSQMSAAVIELYRVLSHEAMDVPALVFLNKQELPTALPLPAVHDLLRLADLARVVPQDISVLEGSAATEQSLDGVALWLQSNRDKS